jgi:hypothetical protein
MYGKQAGPAVSSDREVAVDEKNREIGFIAGGVELMRCTYHDPGDDSIFSNQCVGWMRGRDGKLSQLFRSEQAEVICELTEAAYEQAE